MKQVNKPIYFITGGGTGGHIYPAIAVADFLSSQGKVYYVGNPRNLEYDIVKNKNYKFLSVNVQGLPRKISLDLIKWGIQLCYAIFKSMFYILKYKPNVIFGTGGYVSAPALIAGKLLNIPFVMHDCDANPGLVTRTLAPFASSVSLMFECAKEVVKNKNCFINGNPLRAEFKTMSKDKARQNLGLENKFTIAFMGGSQGAKTINSAVCEIIKTLSVEFDVQVVFQTGKKKFEDVIEKLSTFYPEYQNDKNIIVKPYFEDMISVMKASDIAVSRAGSLSISELMASNVVTIFVPYPFAAADHQRKNAKFVQDMGAGIYLEDKDVTPKKLLELVSSLINNPDEFSKVKTRTFELAKYDAVNAVAEQINSLI